MGFYRRHILPHLIEMAMRKKDCAALRAEWLPQARGDVLEIGIGSGLNLPFYGQQVRKVFGLDPSLELQRMARTRAEGRSLEVEFLLQSAEESPPLPDRSIDTAVVTWSLCSIPNPAKALVQIKRVLKKDGCLIFIEHGQADDPSVVAWQNRLTPMWKAIAGGCHLNRNVDTIIESSGFRITELRRTYLPGPRPITYTYQGRATLSE
jgi:ubiquinone/menaquinone biosynthesis C-methylase UbiE